MSKHTLPLAKKAKKHGHTCAHGSDETLCVEHPGWRACCCPLWHATHPTMIPVTVEHHRPWWKWWGGS